MQNQHKTRVELSADALGHNIDAFNSILSGAKMMAVVKSNAYGHGLVETAKIAEKKGVAWFGVDNVDEGLALRRSGIKKPILILGYTLNSRLRDCVDNGLSFMAYNKETVKALGALKLKPLGAHPSKDKKAAYVHLKIETGTTRQGTAGKELVDLAKSLQKISGVIIEGASTHYANIEDTTDSSYAELQLQRFQENLENLKKIGIDPPWKHTACSAAAILYPETYFNLARVGIAMYGLWPSKETQAVAKREKRLIELRPALTWKTVIAQIKSVKKNTPVSYGLTEKVTRNAKLAVLPVGYWDGYDRRGLSQVGQVLVHGRRCKVVGRICMNMCVIDVTDVPRVKVEDEVVLLGKQGKECISAEDVAAKIGTINYEVVTRINPLLPRIVI
ncbi:MAG: alanine racemase [Patescibacteria group bacterium]|nr:alanine racemase [Patescibacteria group bacterium]